MEKVLQESTAKIKQIIEKQNKRLTNKYNAADKRNAVGQQKGGAAGAKPQTLVKETSLADILEQSNLADGTQKPVK